MKMLAWGLVIVLVDFRMNDGPDIVADPVGWLMCFAALGDAWSRTRSGWFPLAMVGAAVGGIVSIEEYVAPPSGWLVAALTSVATTALVWGTCSGIIAGHPDRGRRANANLIRWFDLSLTVLWLALLIAVGEDQFGIGVPELLLIILPSFAVVIWFIVFVHRIRPDDLVPAAGVPS